MGKPRRMKDKKVTDMPTWLKQQLQESPLNSIRKDIKQNAQTLGAALLGKVGMVSRDDFDKQNEILAEATAQLEDVRKKLKSLEKQLATANATDSAHPPTE